MTTPSRRSPPRCPLLGLPRGEQMLITRGDGRQISASGFGDPQAMRMILLQILTGRRASEIRHLRLRLPVPGHRAGRRGRRGRADRPVPLRPEQDRHRARHHPRRRRGRRRSSRNSSSGSATGSPASSPGTCSFSSAATAHAAKPYPSGTYYVRLREFSKLAQITDSKGSRSGSATPTGSGTPS